MSLKDKVEGNELDLSLNQLTDVPVKELVCNLYLFKFVCLKIYLFLFSGLNYNLCFTFEAF